MSNGVAVTDKDVLIEQLKSTVIRLKTELDKAQLELTQQKELLISLSKTSYLTNKELERATERLSVNEQVITATKCRELQQSMKGSTSMRHLSLSLSNKQRQLKRSYSGEHSSQLETMRSNLVQRLNAGRVAAEMFQDGALTFSELESIQECTGGQHSAAKLLLDIVCKQPYEVYLCFLAALKNTDQEDIYVELKYKGLRVELQSCAI